MPSVELLSGTEQARPVYKQFPRIGASVALTLACACAGLMSLVRVRPVSIGATSHSGYPWRRLE